jgi:hypothetical protein
MQHQIRLNMIASDKYCVTGATAITSTQTPIQDAALALREAGHPDSDTIVATCADVSILPATLAAILKPRKPPRFNPEFGAYLAA